MSRSVEHKPVNVRLNYLKLTLVELALVVLDLLSGPRNAVQTLFLAASHVQIVDAAPGQCRHPELRLVSGLLQPR